MFVYSSETDKWEDKEARETNGGLTSVGFGESDFMYLHVVIEPYESVVIVVRSTSYLPIVLRARFHGSRGNISTSDHLCVRGDGYMMILRLNNFDNVKGNMKMLGRIELWGLTLVQWECISEVPSDLMKGNQKTLWGNNGVLKG